MSKKQTSKSLLIPTLLFIFFSSFFFACVESEFSEIEPSETVEALDVFESEAFRSLPADDNEDASGLGSILGGSHDTTSSAVVGILMKTESGHGKCTGTLIAPNLVLTAQHCVASHLKDVPRTPSCHSTPFDAAFSPASIILTTFAQFNKDPKNYHRVAKIITPSGKTCHDDIALLVLTQNISEVEAKPLLPRVDVEVSAEHFTAIGYGKIGNQDNFLRNRIENRQVKCEGEKCTDHKSFKTDGAICKGDSGGPALDDKGRVFGVASRGSKTCNFAIYASVYEWGDWIREHAGFAALRGKYEPAQWVTEGITETKVVPKPTEAIEAIEAIEKTPGESTSTRTPEATKVEHSSTPHSDSITFYPPSSETSGGCSTGKGTSSFLFLLLFFAALFQKKRPLQGRRS